MISLQTNVDSLNAQENLNKTNQFQGTTIQQLSSGYRINKSGDDAAGLAVANLYQSTITELNQGVINANNGLSQLQIIDGGLSNISTILSRLKTLASESASSTFTGSRATLDQEYQTALGEITRQANNINLGTGGSFATNLTTYVGGANNIVNGQVSVNLANSAVDATGLGLVGSTVGSPASFGGTVNLAGGITLAGAETLAVNYFNGSTYANTTVTVAAGTYGSAQSLLTTINNALSTAGASGITASLDTGGHLSFGGSNAFSITDTTATPALISGAQFSTINNAANYFTDGASVVTGTYATTAQTLTVAAGGQNYTVNVAGALTLNQAVASINQQLTGSGVSAIEKQIDATHSEIEFQSAANFSVKSTTTDLLGGVAGTALTTTVPSSVTSGASAAISLINSAIAILGQIQGKVGAGENLLQYANNLAQTQITNFSSAESQIKDANVAADAANLTKAQVLTQSTIAAMAQANAEPQAVLKLLQG